MSERARSQSGLRLGLLILAVVGLGFAGLFVFGPEPGQQKDPNDRVGLIWGPADVLNDEKSRAALAALQTANPAAAATLETTVQRAVRDDRGKDEIAALTLEAMFAQFSAQAYHVKFAAPEGYQQIMSGLADGLRQLDSNNSDWCKGPQIAAFLGQNDQDLIPALLSEFPYGSPQYDWAMGWMETMLTVVGQAQTTPVKHQKPTFRDETILQQQGLALGSEQWGLALQIAAFANSEGVSYAKMQEVIGSMDVCKLGVAVETVSGRLPEDVRGRIWADLMPEIMVGNTPYAMWRVTDYFFVNY